MSQRWVGLVIVALLALPSVFAHGGIEDRDRYIPDGPDGEVRPPPTVPQGFTGPGREPYLSYFEGVWLYGKMSSSVLEGQHPTDMDADGDWVVWEDAARSDIYAYSISAGQGYYITNDKALQHKPRVSGNVVVYEDHRSQVRPSIYAYFLDTGETRRLSNASRSARDPDIDFPIVAWVDENVTNPDIWGYSLLNNTGWDLHDGTDRDSNPVVIDDTVFWRTYRYNIWDIVGYDTRLEEPIQVTTDGAIQSAPFTNGKYLLYLTNTYEAGWAADTFDLDTQIPRRLPFTLPDASRNSAHGDALVRMAQDVDYSQLVVRNLSSGATNHVSGNLLLTTPPVILDRTVFASVRTREGVSLLQLQVSPFAFAKKPTLTIAGPGDGTTWLRALVVSGYLDAGPEFTEPTTFTYRVDERAPQVIPPALRWRFTLDPAGVEPGRHVVTIRATFREGPPIAESITLLVPAPSQSVDVAQAGPAFHAARLVGELHAYILDNPASYVLIPLVLLLIALVVFRLWIWIKPRRKRAVVEYVTPDEDAA